MKNTIRAMMLGASALAFVAAPAVSTQVFAQDAAAAAQTQCDSPDKTKTYTDFQGIYKTNAEQALTLAKQYVERFGSCNGEGDAAVTDYLKKYIAKTEPRIAFEKLEKEFLAGVQAQNPEVTTRVGKQILAIDPENVAVMLYMVNVGRLGGAQKKIDTYNADIMTYARQAVDKINAGKATSGFGPYKDKDNALAAMHYTMGYIVGIRQQNKVEAAPHLYRSIGFNSDYKTYYFPYVVIGEANLDQFSKAAEEYNKIKDDTTVSEDDKNKAAGMYKAYADRAAEYLARAYTLAKNDKDVKPEVSKGIYDTLTEVYKQRHNQQTTGLDAFIASFNGKTPTDPTTAVTPVIEAAPTTGSAAAPTAVSSTASANEGTRTTGAGTASGNGIGRATSSGTSSAAATTKAGTASGATKATPTKKPAPRKKS